MMMAVSCATTKKMDVSELSGRWEITAVHRKAVPSSDLGAQPVLGFDVKEGENFGNGGCHRITGRGASVGWGGALAVARNVPASL